MRVQNFTIEISISNDNTARSEGPFNFSLASANKQREKIIKNSAEAPGQCVAAAQFAGTLLTHLQREAIAGIHRERLAVTLLRDNISWAKDHKQL